MRRILIFVMAALAAAFLWALVAASNTFAESASWKDPTTITYGGNQYRGPTDENVNGYLKVAKNVKGYTYIENVTTDGKPDTDRKLHLIYFDPSTDVNTATTAKYRTYTYNNRTSFTNPSAATSIDITPPTSSSSNPGTTSCDGRLLAGTGWLICGITRVLANAMDFVFDAISSFLTIRPVTTDPDTALFRAWSYMRSFANIAFVIGFLIIIYSQLTSFGISNYGIKKLLPRLIIAAILVNVSYYICAIAIDISNVLGYSIQELFMNIRNGLVGTEGNNWAPVSWASITGFILSGGTAAAAGGIALFTTVSTYGIAGSIFLLLPVLVTGLLSVLTALLVMAGRQAMVTILVIVSPLAFVAYLLPNTEKWFEKWRSTLMTMLIMFPAFSVVFGGSQLAAAAIIQNADSINLVILGMMVQAAPLMITPLLLKLSGSTLGQLANWASRFQKPVMDRTRKFTDDRAENIKARRLGTPARSWMQRQAQEFDHRRRRRETWRNAHNSMAEARWTNSNDFRNVDQAIREAADRKQIGEQRSQLRYTNNKVSDDRIRTLDTQLRDLKLRNDNANLRADRQWEQNRDPNIVEQKLAYRVLSDQVAAIKAEEDATYEIYKSPEYKKSREYRGQTAAMRALIDDSSTAAQGIAIQAMRSQSAKNVQQKNLAEALDPKIDTTLTPAQQAAIQAQAETLRKEAGAFVIDTQGAIKAQAAAINVVNKADNDNTASLNVILERGNLTDDKLLNIALGRNEIDDEGRQITAVGAPDMVNAAIGRIASSGNQKLMLALSEQIDLSPTGDRDQRIAFADGLKKAGAKPKFWGAGWIAQATQGIVNNAGVPFASGEAMIDKAIIDTINKGKLDAEALSSQDNDMLKRVLAAMERDNLGTLDGTVGVSIDPTAKAELRAEITKAKTLPNYQGKIGEISDVLDDINSAAL